MEPIPFTNKPYAWELFNQLLHEISALGPMEPEMKKASVHIVVPGKSAFLGVHPRTNQLQLNVVLDHPLEGPRLIKSEQVSKNRYHNLVRLESKDGIDSELKGWLGEAYGLAANK